MNRQRLCAVLLLALAAICAPTLRADDRQACAERLSRLGAACRMFMDENQGQPPGQLSLLYYRAYVDDLEAFACPGNPSTSVGREQLDTGSGYVLSPVSTDHPRPLVQDRSAANHGGAGINVYYDDGKVRFEAATLSPTSPVAAPAPPVTTPAPTAPTVSTIPPTTPTVSVPPVTTPTTQPPMVPAYEEGPDIYLGGLKPISLREGGWGRTATDKSVTGGRLGIGTATFDRGLGTHASSEIVYDLTGLRRRYFTALVGVDQAAVKPHGSCGFEVYLDGRRAFSSGTLRSGDAPFPVQVEIVGARELKLVTTDAGDGIYYDQANWAEAKLSNNPPTVPEVVAGSLPAKLLTRPAKDTRIWIPVGGSTFLALKTSACTVPVDLLPGGDDNLLKSLGREILRDLTGKVVGELLDQKAVQVDDLQSGGFAAWWGLQTGDVLLSLGGKSLADTTLAKVVGTFKDRTTPKLTLMRGGKSLSLNLSILDLPSLMNRKPSDWTGGSESVTPPFTDLVLCTGLDDQAQPVAVGNEFGTEAKQIACCLWYENAPAASRVLVTWYRETANCGLAVGLIEGTGRITALLLAPSTEPFQPGTYHVSIQCADRAPVTCTFRVR